jgi:hypothetical protein
MTQVERSFAEVSGLVADLGLGRGRASAGRMYEDFDPLSCWRGKSLKAQNPNSGIRRAGPVQTETLSDKKSPSTDWEQNHDARTFR